MGNESVVELKKWLTGILFVGLTALTGYSCSDMNISGSEDNTTRINFKLTDAPGDYQEVNINVEGLRVHYTPAGSDSTADSTDVDSDDDGKWIDLPFEPMTIDLLTLQNGVDTLLSSAELGPGTYKEVRLLLGENNNVVVDSTTHFLKVPSGQQSGYKIKFDAVLYEGQEIDVTIDFDASRSVHKAGNSGKYMLKPVLRAYVTNAAVEETGSLSGIIQPRESEPLVYATTEGDTVASAQPDTTGAFLIEGLNAGFYDLLIDAANESYRDTTLQNVEIMVGDNTDIGTVSLNLNE